MCFGTESPITPSHPLHVMPPRRTRNSHRPRASDRTMVDLEHQFGLPLFRTRWHRHHPRRKLMSMGNRPSFSREAKLQWAGSREKNLASGRGRTFFLTSLFIELIDGTLRRFLLVQKRGCGKRQVMCTGLVVANPEVVRSRHQEISTGKSALLRSTSGLPVSGLWPWTRCTIAPFLGQRR